MNFDYSEIQVSLQDSLQKYFSKNYTFDKRQAYSAEMHGFSNSAWSHYAEMGLLGLTFPEQYGGLKESTNTLQGIEENAIDTMWIMEELGKTLCLEPYLTTVVMGGGTLLNDGTELQKTSHIPKIANGQLKISIAHQEPESRYDIQIVRTTATLKKDAPGAKKTWIINGKKSVVLNADCSDFLIVDARTDGDIRDSSGISLFLIPTSSSGVILSTYKTHDASRASDIEFRDVLVSEDDLISRAGEGLIVLQEMMGRANAALCAQAVGVMSKICDLTLDYLKTRKQFGVPIGKFQALQHRMADMIVSTEQARSMAIFSVKALTESDFEKRHRDLSAAKAYICRAGRAVGQEAIQLHGGMGVTNEMSVAHYFKKLTLITQTFGDFNFHIEKVSDYLLADH